MTDHRTHSPQQTLVIRGARLADRQALTRLAQLEGHRELNGDRILVAEVDGVPRAAFVLDGDLAIGDPFHPTASLLDLLRLRAAQLRGEQSGDRRGRLRTWLAALRRPSARGPAIAPATPGNAGLMIARDRG